MTARTTTMPISDVSPMNNEQLGGMGAVIVAVGAIITATTLWLDKRAKAILADGTAELRAEVAKLTARVEVLEQNNREARGHIIDAITLAATDGAHGSSIIESLKKAQGILH